jgi:type IV pilus assembly protein PilC
MKDNKPLLYFRWQGITALGQICHGFLAAYQRNEAQTHLQQQGIIVRKLHQSPWIKPIKSEQIHDFARQMASLLEAGIPLLQSFDLTIHKETHPGMKYLLLGLKKHIESGLSFSEALNEYPRYFRPLLCHLVAAGEKSGSLETSLRQIAADLEKMLSLQKKIKKNLSYPIILLVLASLLTLGFLTFVVPQFEALFVSFAAPLPRFTRWILFLSQGLQQHLAPLFALLTGIIYKVNDSYQRHPRWKYIIQQWQIKLPLIGPITRHAALARFAHTLSMTYAAGLPLMHALELASIASGHVEYQRSMKQVQAAINKGLSLTTALEHSRCFPPQLLQMLAMGEESGTLEQMLQHIAKDHTTELEQCMDKLCRLFEPLVITVVGGIIGALVIAMYLPIIQLGKIV